MRARVRWTDGIRLLPPTISTRSSRFSKETVPAESGPPRASSIPSTRPVRGCITLTSTRSRCVSDSLARFALHEQRAADLADVVVAVPAAVAGQQLLEDPVVDRGPAEVVPGLADHPAGAARRPAFLLVEYPHDGGLDGPPAEVEQQVDLAGLDVRAVAQRRGGGLVDEPEPGHPGRLGQPVLVVLEGLHRDGQRDLVARGRRLHGGEGQHAGLRELRRRGPCGLVPALPGAQVVDLGARPAQRLVPCLPGPLGP